MNPHPLAPLLEPSSIAIVGASDEPAAVGAVLLRHVRAGFKGPVYAVNPGRRTVRGEPCYASVADLPAAVDLALIATPPETIAPVLRDCGRRGVRSAAILTSALSEATSLGASQVGAVWSTAREHHIRLLGPNTLGLMRPSIGLNATFASSAALPGPVALVAQSGAMVSAVLDWADVDEVGFSSVVSLGNTLDVEFADVLDFLTLDALTESIVLYVEGIRRARKFLSALRAAARTKPIIVLKAGRELAGSRAAATHTGSAATRDDVFDAALRRSGAVRVRTFLPLFSAAKCLASRYRPTGNHLAIVTNGGGPGVMAADWACDAGVELAGLSAATVERLDRLLPAAWSRANPVDLLEDADVGRYRAAVQACLEDPNVDGLLVILAPQAMTQPQDVARALIELTADHPKHVFACWMGDRTVHSARRLLSAARIPVFRSPEPTVEAFSNLAAYYQNQQHLMQVPGPLGPDEPPDLDGARRSVERFLSEGRTVLTESEAKTLVSFFRIPVAAAKIARSAQEAAALAQEIGFPVAMKASSTQIAHKRAAGGVVLGVRGAAAAQAAYEQIVQAVSIHAPGARGRRGGATDDRAPGRRRVPDRRVHRSPVRTGRDVRCRRQPRRADRGPRGRAAPSQRLFRPQPDRAHAHRAPAADRGARDGNPGDRARAAACLRACMGAAMAAGAGPESVSRAFRGRPGRRCARSSVPCLPAAAPIITRTWPSIPIPRT